MQETKAKFDPGVFWPALIVVLGIAVPSMIWPEQGGKILTDMRTWLCDTFGWLYLSAGAGIMGLLLWLAFGKYGNVKFGGPDDEPEFKTTTWIAMLFCAGIGSSLIYWAVLEPIYYLQGPPLNAEPGSRLAGELAMMYGAFHWGPSAWALYCIPTLPIAYNYYVRKDPHLRISNACESVLGRHVHGIWGKIIDVTVIFGIIGGVGTTLGLGTPMVSALISKIFGIPESFGLNIVILCIWTLIFGTSVWLGLKKGIAILSDINMYLAIALAAFVLAVGPTTFILNGFTNAIGLFLDNFLRMSLWTDPVAKGGFPQSWTVFYWAWWVAYAPMMGLFVARISKGRTVREVVLAELVWGTFGCWVYFGILGCYSVYTELNAATPVSAMMKEMSAAMAIVTMLNTLPFNWLVLPVVVLLQFVFLATTLDSSAYVMASVCYEKLKGSEEPPRWSRVVWALTLGVMAVAMFAIGGLGVLQASSIILAFPFLLVIGVLIWSFLRMVREDYGEILDEKHRLQAVEYTEDGVRVRAALVEPPAVSEQPAPSAKLAQ